MKLAHLFLLLIVSATPATGAPWTDQAIDQAMIQMEQYDRTGLDAVLNAPDEAPSYILLVAAKCAAVNEQLEDAAFLLYAGMLRYRIDLSAYGMAGRDPEPEMTVAAAGDKLGPRVVPQLFDDPARLKRVFNRLDRWKPLAPPGYAPGWSVAAAPVDQAFERIVAREKGELLPALKNLTVLVTDLRYREHLRRLIDPTGAKETEVVRSEAELARIERARGLPAIYGVIRQ